MTRPALHRWIGIGWLMLASAACQKAPDQGVRNESEIEAIRAQAELWFKSIKEKDLEATLSFYAPDAEYLSAGRPAASTADERRRLWKEDFATPAFSSDEVTTRIEVAQSGDLAYQRGNYSMNIADAQGKMTRTTGKFIVIWKKQGDGRWKAIVDIDNADQ